jgi:hypothetical protein
VVASPVVAPVVVEAPAPPAAPIAAAAAAPLGGSHAGPAAAAPGTGGRRVLIVAAVVVVVLALAGAAAFVGLKVLHGSQGTRATVVDTRTGVVMAVGPDKEAKPEDSGISDVTGRIGQFDSVTGQVDYSWVAQVGDQLYAKVGATGNGSELVRSAIGDKDSVSLFQSDTNFDAVVLADGSVAITEYKDGNTGCYLTKDGASAIEIASGAPCWFSPDGTRVVQVKSSDSGTDVAYFTADGKPGPSFTLRSADKDSVTVSRDLAVVGYTMTSESGKKTGYAVDATGKPLGNTEAMAFLQLDSSGPGMIFKGDASGVANFWVAAQGRFGLVGQGDGGAVALSSDGTTAVAVTLSGSRAKIEKVAIGGKPEQLVAPIKAGSDMLTANSGRALLVYPGDGASSYVQVNLNDLTVSTLKVRSTSAGTPTFFAAVPQGILLSTSVDNNGTTENTTSLIAGDSARVIANDSIYPVGIDESRLVYSTQNTVNVVDLATSDRPQRLLGGSIQTPAFVQDGNLLGTVGSTEGDGEGLPTGDYVSVPLDGSGREQVIAASAVVANVPGALPLNGLLSGYFGGIYDAQSLTVDEAITQGASSTGCSQAATTASPLSARTGDSENCYLVRATGDVTVAVRYAGSTANWSSYSGYGSVSVTAISSDGSTSDLGTIQVTEACIHNDAYGYCDTYGAQPNTSSFTAPSGTIAYAIRLSAFTSATARASGSSV